MARGTEEIWTVGRRKTASARVRIIPGSGKITVNKQDFKEYFPSAPMRGYVMQPLELTEQTDSFDITANIKGGGKMGQAGALRHGIARAISKAKEELRSPLKAEKMLTRDARMKERKKYGQPGARKRYQFSKR